MKRYPEYKDSGVEWIGEIPIGWKVIKFKFVTTLMTCGHAATPEYVDSDVGMPFLSAQNIKNQKIDLFTFNYITKELFDSLTKNHKPEKGDLLQVRVGGASTIGETAVIESDFDFTIYVSLAHIKLNKLALNYYIKNLCNSDAFKKYSSIIMKKGAGVANLNVSDLEKYRIPLPPINEQSQIATFLDHKTRQIDDLIAKKQKLKELLNEERTALINNAVTKGINPNANMKDSGIEWLGNIPEHWEVKKVKQVLKNLDYKRIPLSSEERGKMTLKTFDYYGASGVIDKVDNYLFDGEYILIGEDGANILTRSSAMAYKATGRFWVNNHAHILEPYEGMIDFFVNLLEQIDYSCYASGSAQPKLTQDKLENISITVPPLSEQNEIVEFLETKCSHIESVLSRITKEIELISEYKTSLINEAVTGKIDVRGYQINNA